MRNYYYLSLCRALGDAALTLQSAQKSQVKAFGDNGWGWGWGIRSQLAESRWRKTEQRSQRSAGGDSGSVGRPLRHVLSGCGMTAQAQLVLDARAAAGRSVQVIKPFMHSSTQPQASYANSRGEVTTVYHCFCWTPERSHTPLSLFLPSFLPPSPEMSCFAPSHFFLFFLLTNPQLHFLSASLFFPLTHSHSLLRTLTHST